jgi:nucleotide-binding universal stress UspA family protein
MSGIIVGVDGSEHSLKALRWALLEAAAQHAPVTVMTVHPAAVRPGATVFCPMPLYADNDDDLEFARKAVWELVDKAISDTSDNVPAIVRLVRGDPATELLREASDADMLVVGSRGAGGFTRLMMGSVSTKIVHHAICPIVVIPGDAQPVA